MESLLSKVIQGNKLSEEYYNFLEKMLTIRRKINYMEEAAIYRAFAIDYCWLNYAICNF